MSSDERPRTDHVGQVFSFTTLPDAEGWQVTYEVGVQGEEYVADGAPVGRPGEQVRLTRGEELVVIGIAVRSVVAEAERSLHGSMRTIPGGGLTARRARELIRPGAALREFLRAADEGRLQGPVDVRRKGTTWVAKPIREYLEFRAWLKTLPAMRELVRRGPLALLTREQRKAQTAALYVQAIAAGNPAPRRRVAEAQGREEAAVRDDLHAARAESPPLLVGGAAGKIGGRLTDDGRRIIEEMQQTAAKPRRKGGKP